MIITRTPYRISFFGGGTDYPSWFNHNGGLVISSTINKYSYLNVRYIQNFFNYKYRVVWSKIENCNSLNEIKHPCVREMLKFLKYDFKGIEIKHSGDLPARSGIGSSSSFTVGLLNALTNLNKKKISKKELYKKSIFFEQNILKEDVGSQDQVAAAKGGFNQITFKKNNFINTQKINLSDERTKELESSLMLFFSGIQRDSSKNAKKIIKNIENKYLILNEMKSHVLQAKQILQNNNDLEDFGKLLNESWELKKKLAKTVSNSKIDDIYNNAISSGALGGKVLGSGNGGFLLFYVPKKNQKKVLKKFNKLLHVPFKFEYSGSEVIFNGM